MSFVAEFWMFLKERKKLWLLPLLIVMAAIGSLLIFAGNSAFAPFIYTLF